MSFSRRGIFKFLAAAPIVAAAAKSGAGKAEPHQLKPELVVGQIRSVQSHYETRWGPYDGGHTHAFTIANCAGGYACPVAVVQYEEWDGAVWRSVSYPTKALGAA